METAKGGVQVKLGGAWKALEDEKKQLREHIDSLEEQLKAEKGSNGQLSSKLRKVEEDLRCSSLRAALSVMHRSVFEKREKDAATSLARLRKQREIEASTATSHQEEAEAAKQANVLLETQLKKQKDALWAAENERTFLKKECHVLQAQYERKESEVSELQQSVERLQRECALIEKAKGQKEKYLVTLVNQNDRLREENLKHRKLASKKTGRSREQVNRATPSPQPTKPRDESLKHDTAEGSWRKILSTGKEQANTLNKPLGVRKYDALERLKKELVACQQAKAEAEMHVLRLKSENESLKVRYRNQSKTRTTKYG